jgi:hypothetical protein
MAAKMDRSAEVPRPGCVITSAQLGLRRWRARYVLSTSCLAAGRSQVVLRGAGARRPEPLGQRVEGGALDRFPEGRREYRADRNADGVQGENISPSRPTEDVPGELEQRTIRGRRRPETTPWRRRTWWPWAQWSSFCRRSGRSPNAGGRGGRSSVLPGLLVRSEAILEPERGTGIREGPAPRQAC